MTTGGAWLNLIWVYAACAVLGLSIGSLDLALAQELPVPDVRVSLVADSDELTVGELVTLTLEVTHPSDHSVVLPRLRPEWGPFEVRTQTPARTLSTEDGIWTTLGQYRVTLFAPGEFKTPAVFVSVRTPDGKVSEVPIPVVRLRVKSVLSGPGDSLRDIRSHADLSTSFWSSPATRALAALSALVAMGTAAYFVRRRHRRGEATPEPIVDTRTPLEAATQELDRIEGLDLPGSGRFKEHYALVSALTRDYLQATYFEETDGLDAERMTTDEIEASLRLSSLGQQSLGLVCDLLVEADIVKYSGYTPPASVAREALVEARAFLYQNAPNNASPATGAANSGQGVQT